ncbi:Beta-cyclopiazonate dehydrogenase [Lachnellula suecica]|uniref:Beta-cyclopiazonate dehydrogenase n=1 Tax=Lachnellula suecica TaxID=602035 RepID=A0A8T9C9I7_9HELO|nr:Beta-cyclopiazonate dehydrogenase [Lachnellula suecica]
MTISEPWVRRRTPRNFIRALVFASVVIGHSPLPVVYKDVAILGGGASGTYAAVRLREDYGKSVFLIEKEAVLGGHVNTYSDPETNGAFNYGVQSYIDYKGARAFFERFGIPLQSSVLYSSNTTLVDSITGKPANVPTPPPLNSPAAVAALEKYYGVILPWNDFLLPGYWNFPPGDQIPTDLLLPFRDFVAKYGIADMAYILNIVSGQDINSTKPTLYVVKNFGTPVVEGFLNNTFFDPAPFDLSLLYGDAEQLLGDDVVLTSTVLEASRLDYGVRLVVENLQTGAKTLVLAKRLLVASPPSIDNLAVFGLDEQEKAVFNTWSFGTGYTAVLKTNLIPDNTSVAFITSGNETQSPSSFSATWNGVSEYFWIIFGSSEKLSTEEAKDVIVGEMQTLYAGGSFPPIDDSTPSSEVVAISNHSQVEWGQSVEQLQAGFIQDLYALQGHKSTWYTGGLWCPDYSSNVWAFTDTVLPKLLENI